jgi:hypothetical protein
MSSFFVLLDKLSLVDETPESRVGPLFQQKPGGDIPVHLSRTAPD